jgi:hypothetical protein
MGQSPAETVKEIEEVRERLTVDIAELQRRMPRPAVWGKRAIGVALGGGVAGTLFLFTMRRVRRRRRKSQMHTVVNVVPEDLTKALRDRFDDERVRRAAVAVAGLWLLFRLAELRQLRRLRQATLAR